MLVTSPPTKSNGKVAAAVMSAKRCGHGEIFCVSFAVVVMMIDVAPPGRLLILDDGPVVANPLARMENYTRKARGIRLAVWQNCHVREEKKRSTPKY